MVAAVVGVSRRGGCDQALEVQTAKSEHRKIVQKVRGTGKIQPKTQVKISTGVSSRIIRLVVVEGQWVEKGTFLVELDRERYLAAVESAEATVRSAEANATRHRRDPSGAASQARRAAA